MYVYVCGGGEVSFVHKKRLGISMALGSYVGEVCGLGCKCVDAGKW